MNPHVDDLLPALALGTLHEAERAEVEGHLGQCPRCAEELSAVRELVAVLPLAESPVWPSPRTRERLLEDAATGRLYRFAERAADLLGIAVERAKVWLDRLDDPEAWQPLDIPGAGGISLMTPERSPRLDGCAVAFLRIKPGATFPLHGHLAEEKVLILQGGYIDDVSGIEYGPGDIHEAHKDSSHSYTGVPGPDCLCLGVVEGKIQVGGVEIG